MSRNCSHIPHCKADKQWEELSVFNKLEHDQERLEACDQLGSTQEPPEGDHKGWLKFCSLSCLLIPLYIHDLQVNHSLMTWAWSSLGLLLLPFQGTRGSNSQDLARATMSWNPISWAAVDLSALHNCPPALLLRAPTQPSWCRKRFCGRLPEDWNLLISHSRRILRWLAPSSLFISQYKHFAEEVTSFSALAFHLPMSSHFFPLSHLHVTNLIMLHNDFKEANSNKG